MTYFGNEYWNKATDNSDKTIIPIQTKDVDSLVSLMDKVGMNYYGYSNDNYTKIAINKNDIDVFRQIVGDKIAASIHYQQPKIPYAPPEKNIIGNSEYRYIPNKKYFQADTDTILKMAEIMEREGIKFSGRIYGDNSKLTVSSDDIEKLSDIKSSVEAMRKSGILAYPTDVNSEVNRIHDEIVINKSSLKKKKEEPFRIGELDHTSISHKEYYRPYLTYEHFKDIEIFLKMQTAYSAVVEGDNMTFCCDSHDMPMLVTGIRIAENQYSIIMELMDIGLTNEQLETLMPAAKAAAQNGYTSISEWVDKRDTINDLSEMADRLCKYYSLSDVDRIQNKDNIPSELADHRKNLNNVIALRDIFENHNYSSEQMALIRKGYNNGLSDVMLNEIDDDFTADEINMYFDMYEKAVSSEIAVEDVKEYLNKVKLFHKGVLEADPTLSNFENTLDIKELIGVDKISYNGSSFYWTYFNEDGNDGKGQFIELTITEYDIQQATVAMENAGGRTESGYQAFIDYIEQHCDQTSSIDEDFEAERDNFLNGDYDITVNSGSIIERNQVISDFINPITTISVNDLDFEIDLKGIDSYVLETEYENYIGGTDENGHERKDNYSSEKKRIEISLTYTGKIEVDTYDSEYVEHPDMKIYDQHSSEDMAQLSSIIYDYISNNKGVTIYSMSNGIRTDIEPPLFGVAKAIDLINDFSINEYGNEADTSNLFKIALAYTTTEDGEHEIQVEADLVNRAIKYRFDGVIYRREQYTDIDDMNVNGLTGLNFDEMVALSEDEQAFLTDDIPAYMSKSVVAWDEIEDMGYILFEEGYIERHNASEKAIFGNNLKETELFDLANRMHDGEDIRAELGKKLIGRQNYFRTRNDDEFTTTEDGNKLEARYRDVVREISYVELGEAYLKLIENEYNDIIHDRTIEELRDVLKDLSEEQAEELIRVFDNNIMDGWKSGDDQIKINHIKRALYNKLGNDEDKTEKAFAAIADMKYNVKFESVEPEKSDEHDIVWEPVTDTADDNGKVDVFSTNVNGTIFWIEPTENGYAVTMEYGDGSIRPISEEYNNFESRGVAEDYFYEDRDNILAITKDMSQSRTKKVDTYINISENTEHYKIYQLPAGEKYHGIRFMSRETLENEGVQLSQQDYEMVYEGEVSEFDVSSVESKLEGIFEKFNISQPKNYKGRSVSVSDVITITNGSDETAYYVDTFGFKEMPEFFKKEIAVELKEERTVDETKSDVPEQLSLFGDSEPISAPKPSNSVKKPDFSSGPIIDGVQVYEALAAEILEGTGYVNGKFRVQEFYEKSSNQPNHPTIKELADFLKKEHGIGGHSGHGNIFMVDYDSKGMTFSFRNGEKFRHSWYNVAVMTESKLVNGTYLSSKEKEKWQTMKAESSETDIPEPYRIKTGDRFRHKANGEIIEVVSMSGALPYYEDEYTISHVSGAAAVTENVSYNKLLHDIYEYIGNAANEHEKTAKEQIAEESFTITDESLGEGGAKTKYKANCEAIKTLKLIESEDRSATDSEKELLSKYVGWGGIANAFNPENDKWKNEYAELKALLTEKEYSSARASVLDSYYTSPIIIDNIYAALKKMGFEGGNILEPSCGVGNFLGRMPKDLLVNSKVYATEIDSISGRIAQKLYPNAEIKIEGFEKNKYQEESFDVAVGNVPFGDLPFKDTVHNTSKLHDYFFAEALDKVKDGGVLAFVTSSGTLDKADERTRKMLAEKAELIGAIRLPNTAFKANAGTEVTSDIIFLKKNNSLDISGTRNYPDWVHIDQTDDGFKINSYFAKHPEMVLGEIVAGNKLYGREDDTMCIPIEGADLKEQLSEAVNRLSAQISDVKAAAVYPAKKAGDITPPEGLRNYSLFEYENRIYFKTDDSVYDFRYDKTNKQHNKVKAFIDLRDCTRKLLTAQEENHSDTEIRRLQVELNELYDDFYTKYGLINSAANKKVFREDISYNLVSTLEKEYTDDKLISKSDIFTKRTIMPAKAIDHVDSPTEALALSMAEKGNVDFEYMEKLTDKSKEQLIAELKGEIFEIPFSDGKFQTASEYLSGDIRQKLHAAESAADMDEKYNENVAALYAAMPEPLKAGDIDVHIGATWIDPKYYEQFMYETFGTPSDKRSDIPSRSFWRKKQKIEVEYSKYANQFNITNKRADRSIVVSKTYGTDKINAYEIMECLLNLKDPKITKAVRDDTGKEKRVVDIEATKLAQKKAEKIRSAFKEWIFDKQERREDLVNTYNVLFNSIRPREYDGSHLRFPQMNSDITMQEHQKNAIAHAIFGGNTLFAHSVGAGKTYEMIASAMESKRLGLCTKSLMCVPNHLTEQIGADFMKLYPSANILVATKNDFTKNNRRQLFSKIATGNYDAIIIGHSQLKMIPMNKERQEALLQAQIDDITEGIKTYKSKYEEKDFNVKAMERIRRGLEQKLEELKAKKQDDVITFEEMGIDKLIVDEAHEFKNLFTPTKMQNVSGISSSASQKSLDLFMKCQYLDEKTGGKGVILATGTPLSNSVTELHTMMRFLEYDFLKSKDLQHFDNWIAIFGQQKTDWELAPAGNKFKQRTRIAEFSGLPELMSMFKQVADVRTADTLDLNVPECETHIVNVEATEFQKTLVRELADRADDVQDGKVDPTIDNMLRITSDGRKLGLDPRLIDPAFEDDPGTKLNQCVNNVYDIYKSTDEDRLTQIIFCDLGVPHRGISEKEDTDEKSVSEQNSLEEECDFCVYDDIRQKLISKGVKPEEIAYIHDAKSEKQKSDLFEKVRSGEIRILLGSTPKMGTGTNVQNKLIAIHDLDIPWRPADLEQRKGRIVRQGNNNKNVHLYRYVTKGTFDAYSYQTLENKQKFIAQIMTSKTPIRKCEDVDQQALSYAEIKTLCTGDERIKEKMQLDSDVKGLQIERAEYINTKHDMEDKIAHAPKQEQNYLTLISNLKKDKEHLAEFPESPEFRLVLNGKVYGNEDRTEAAKAFESAFFNAVNRNPDKSVKIGEFQGMALMVSSVSLNGTSIHSATLNGAASHKIDIGASFANNIKRLEGVLNDIDIRIADLNSKLNELRIDVAEAKKIVAAPFAHEDELKKKTQRLEQLTEELNTAAMEQKENNKCKQRTNYFDVAKLKKEAAKCRNAAEKIQKKSKKNEKTADVVEA